jgi:hypothetical protein
MITCPSCGARYNANVTPLYCACGVKSFPVVEQSQIQPLRQQQSNHWRTLHEYAYRTPYDADAAKAFITQWTADIAKHTPSGCGCQSNWDQFGFTFQFDSAEAFQDSTVDGHNLVRAKLGQPQFDYDQARRYWSGPRVGFLALSYATIGGTETFHRMLIPRLRERINVVGFVATGHHTGDPRPLKVPYATGAKAIAPLAAQCDVLISWGVKFDQSMFGEHRPKIIAVHHSDSQSHFTDLMLNQPGFIDHVVCVNRDVAEQRNATYIANCVDPLRLISSNKIETNAKKIVLFAHRFAEEKRPLLACDIADALPDDYQMVMVGGGHLESRVRRRESAKLRVIGPQPNVADWLAVAHRFLSLATFEGYGLSVAEALAAGVPVVSTATGIAQGRALTLPVDSTVQQWVEAILQPQERIGHSDLCDVDRFVGEWEQVIRRQSR